MNRRIPGVLVRLHDRHANDLGFAHVPPPVELEDLVCTEHAVFRVADLVPSPEGAMIVALVRVEPAKLHVVAR